MQRKDEHEHRLAMLEEAMSGLNEREIRVFKARRLTDMPEPLDNLAEELRNKSRTSSPD